MEEVYRLGLTLGQRTLKKESLLRWQGRIFDSLSLCDRSLRRELFLSSPKSFVRLRGRFAFSRIKVLSRFEMNCSTVSAQLLTGGPFKVAYVVSLLFFSLRWRKFVASEASYYVQMTES